MTGIPTDAASLAKLADLEKIAHALRMPVEDGFTLCPNPDHLDTEPSCHIFTGDVDGKMRAKCQSCGWKGDSIDFIRAVRRCSFAEAVDICHQLVSEGATAPIREASQDQVNFYPMWADAYRLHLTDPVTEFVTERRTPYSMEWLRKHFGVTGAPSGDSEIWIPHRSREAGVVHAMKRRRGASKLSMERSRYLELYGSWRDRGQPYVLLCEGETDVWSATWWLKDSPSWVVLGLPSGVATVPAPGWLDQLTGRSRVVLGFDGDRAGWAGSVTWYRALDTRSTVRWMAVPPGKDVSSMRGQHVMHGVAHPHDLWDLIDLQRLAQEEDYDD